MKKLLITFLLFAPSLSHCLEPEDAIVPFLERIRQKLQDQTPQVLNNSFADFLESPAAQSFEAEIASLSLEDKNRLMKKIKGASSSGATWSTWRNYMASIIRTGGFIDTIHPSRYIPSTFLREAIFQNDLPAVKFALAHNANAALPVYSSYGIYHPLNYAKTYQIAKLLIDHNGLEPFKDNQVMQLQLAQKSLHSEVCYRVLQLYKENGINLNVKDSQGSTLLHTLSLQHSTPYQFFEKLKILLKAKAVYLDAQDMNGETALDIIKMENQNDPRVKLARILLEKGHHKIKRLGLSGQPQEIATDLILSLE